MKRRVLVLCTGNSARSQMAEGWIRSLGHDRYDVVSAGTQPVGVNPLAIVAMRERGIDISAHTSKPVTQFLDECFDLLITVCDNARETCPIFPGVAQKMHWPLEDPAAVQGSEAQRLASFRRIRDQIETHVRTWLGAAT